MMGAFGPLNWREEKASFPHVLLIVIIFLVVIFALFGDKIIASVVEFLEINGHLL